MPRIAFMVMPFGEKETLQPPGKAPARVDFDRLWSLAFQPLLRDLGYDAYRADQSSGAAIVQEMLKQLAISDLVLADLTLPNPNVYYEVGVRHAARRAGCVLVAADWARQPFDTAQIRHVPYALPDGTIPDAVAAAIRDRLRPEIGRLSDSLTPCFELTGFPELPLAQANTFRESLLALAAFDAELERARLLRGRARAEAVDALVRANAGRPLDPRAALRLVALVRDCAPTGWRAVLDLVDGLDPSLRALPVVLEQRALALSKLGRHEDAVADLERLVALYGETPERRGLLGGRFKALFRAARDAAPPEPGEAARWRDRAIEEYRRGMDLDLNEYYCAGNLPRLLRQRGDPGDEELAQRAAQVTLAACERRLGADADDGWIKATLLVAAFDAGDVARARALAADVRRQGPAAWQLASALADVDDAVRLLGDAPAAAPLREVAESLRRIASG